MNKIKIRKFRALSNKVLILFFLWGLLFSCSTGNNKKVPNNTPPNVLILLADDMGFGDLKSFNPESKIYTPNLDNLAAEGMIFTNAHSPGPWCVPSRNGLLTGCYPFRNTRKYNECMIADDRITIADFLQQNNYQTACFGKWHQGIINEKKPGENAPLLKGPTTKGFDYFYGIHASLDIPPYYYIENDKCVKFPTDTIGDSFSEGWSKIQGKFWRGGGIAPGFKHDEVLPTLTQKVKQYLVDYKNSETKKPFFLYYAITAPHTPWLPDEEFAGSSNVELYGDFIEMVDKNIGSVLQTLKELKLDENTLVIFSSDNGPVWFPADVEKYKHKSVGPLSGMKADVLEGGHRVPFIVKWKNKVQQGTNSNKLICFTDIFATLAETNQIQLPENTAEDSYSFYPLLTGKTELFKRPPFLIANGGLTSITVGNWKYINGKGPGGFTNRIKNKPPSILPRNEFPGQLYNLKNDIGERKNLYSDNPDKVEELSTLLNKIVEKGYTREGFKKNSR